MGVLCRYDDKEDELLQTAGGCRAGIGRYDETESSADESEDESLSGTPSS